MNIFRFGFIFINEDWRYVDVIWNNEFGWDMEKVVYRGVRDVSFIFSKG